MGVVLHHVLLAIAVLGLSHAALRAASRVAPSGLERAVLAAVLAVAAAVAMALALALVGLGADTLALCAATAVVWAAVLLLVPAPQRTVREELVAWFGRMEVAWRFAVAALGGAFVAWVVWQVANPSIGFDGSVYHYAEVAGWIVNGEPGSVLRLSYDIPYGHYPLTDEVAMTWAAGIARSWIPLALWNPAMLLVLVGATVLTLRNLAVPPVALALATVALVGAPVVVRQLNEPQTDLPTLAWLASTVALATGAARRPALLVPAVVAAGLAVGTKTTSATIAIAALGVGLVLARGHLRPLAGWLAVGLAAAFAVGGIWYARNLVQHGSPLWPFAAAPWGDPAPPFFKLIGASFASHPQATLAGRLGDYTARLGGIWLLVLGAIVVAVVGVLARRRALVVAGGIAVLGILVWSIAPGTGEQTAPGQFLGSGWPISTARYILPAAFAAMVAVALAAGLRGGLGRGATAVLATAAAWSLVATARVGHPWTPPLATLVVGAAAGALVLAAATAIARMRSWRVRAPSLRWGGVTAIAAAAAIGAAVAPASDGFIARHANVDNSSALGRHVVGYFAAQPGFERSDAKIFFISRSVQAPLAGDHFTHPLELMPADAMCALVRAIARRSPVVLTDPTFLRGFLGVASYTAARCLSDRRPVFRDPAFRVYRP